MMTIEAAIVELLVQDTAVDALVDGRGYQLKFPQGPTYPALRVQLISEPIDYDLQAPTGLVQSLVQVDAAAAESDGGDPYDAVSQLGAAIDAALSGKASTVGGSPDQTIQITAAFRVDRRVQYDPDELRVILLQQDYRVWWHFQ